MVDVFQYSGALLGIGGALLVSLKHRLGFLCWIIGNASWIIYGFMTGALGLIVQFLVFEFIAIFGWLNWKRR